MIKRHLEIALRDHLFKDKTVVLYGARQVGKTTLINEVVKKTCGIMRTRTGFWVTLETECRFICAMDTLQSAIKQRFVRHTQCVG